MSSTGELLQHNVKHVASKKKVGWVGSISKTNCEILFPKTTCLRGVSYKTTVMYPKVFTLQHPPKADQSPWIRRQYLPPLTATRCRNAKKAIIWWTDAVKPGILYKVTLVGPPYLQSKLDSYEDHCTRTHTNVSVRKYR